MHQRIARRWRGDSIATDHDFPSPTRVCGRDLFTEGGMIAATRHHIKIYAFRLNHASTSTKDWQVRRAASILGAPGTTKQDFVVLEWCESISTTKGHEASTDSAKLKRGAILTHNPQMLRNSLHNSTIDLSGKVLVVGDSTAASPAARFLRQNTDGFLIYRESNDYNNARQLLTALKSRVVKPLRSPRNKKLTIAQIWHHQRRWKRQQTQLLNRLLLQVKLESKEGGNNLKLDIPYRRAPQQTITEILQNSFSKEISSRIETVFLISLRELLGLIGSQEWSKRGVTIHLPEEASSNESITSKVTHYEDSLMYQIHPQHGVFVPTRREYLGLLFQQKILPNSEKGDVTVLDVGTGTGVIAAQMLLQHRHIIRNVTCTDSSPFAIKCAKANFERLSLTHRTTLIQTDDCTMFPQMSSQSKFDLIICNPPWIPGQGDSLLDAAVYDPESKFLKAFLRNVRYYLRDESSQVWLVISDLAERLGLRQSRALVHLIQEGGLRITGTSRTNPWHPKAYKAGDAKKHAQDLTEVTAARTGEITTLYILQPNDDDSR